MSVKKKKKVSVTRYALTYFNIILSIFISVCVTTFASESKYFRYGPSEDFVLISVKINTDARYAFLLFLIACNNCIKVLISELGEPILAFNVYNPDKKVITELDNVQPVP